MRVRLLLYLLNDNSTTCISYFRELLFRTLLKKTSSPSSYESPLPLVSYRHKCLETPLGASRAFALKILYQPQDPYLYKSTLMSNGESKSFNIACFVSFSERLACSVGIFQSIPRLSSRMLIPPSASG